jgi:anti-sigma-K factor RskA
MLAVFALDAVDAEEGTLLEAHLAVCPRCRAELDAHRDVAAALGNSVEPLPPDLWSRISNHVLRPTGADCPPMPALLREVPAPVEFSDDQSLASHKTPGRGRVVSVAAVAIAAAAAAAGLGFNLVGADNHVAHLQGAIGESARTAVVAAFETPGHRVVNLDSVTHHRLAQIVTVPGGRGYLASSDLPALSSAQTYQLWAVIDGQTISLGLLGANPHLVAFTLAGSPRASTLGITAEPAGGAVLPSERMLASGRA